jgi:hypothetical protein
MTPQFASKMPKRLKSQNLDLWVVLALPGTELTASCMSEYTQNAEGSQVAFSVLHRIMQSSPMNVKIFTYY